MSPWLILIRRRRGLFRVTSCRKIFPSQFLPVLSNWTTLTAFVACIKIILALGLVSPGTCRRVSYTSRIAWLCAAAMACIYRPPVTQQFGLNIQTDLGHSFVLELGYVGTRGTHQIQNHSLNQAVLASAS